MDPKESVAERARADTTTFRLINKVNELFDPPAEVMKLRNYQHIPASHGIETGSEARSLGARATSAIIEHLLTARSCQSLDMTIEHLQIFARGTPG